MRSLILLSENYVNDLCTFTVTSGESFKSRLYDKLRDPQYTTVGSTDGATEQVTIEFVDRGGNAIARSIDRLFLQNTNLSRFYFDYWNGTTWVQIAESVFGAGTENDDEDVLIEMAAPVSTTKIRLTATHTIGAAAQKLIGEIRACLYLLLLRHQVSIEREDWDDGGSYRLQGGALVTFLNVRKFDAGVEFMQVTLASYEILVPLLEQRAAMTWILWQDFRPADVFEVAAKAAPKVTLDKKMQLYDISCPVGEL